MSSILPWKSNYKIPKIKHESTVAVSIESDYPLITVTQLDMFHIFYNLTILFIGDSSIRTLFRDFIKIFSDNHLLQNSEAAMQHGEYKEIEGETRLRKFGRRGTEEYKDVRQYFCKSSSTRLIYIHLPTINGESPIENINYLQTITDCTYIHAVIFSSYHGDLNFNQIAKSQSTFEDLLQNYNNNLTKLCIHLSDICRNKKDCHQQRICMGPYPPHVSLSSEQQNQFHQIIHTTKEIVEKYGFHTFNRNFYWEKTHGELLLRNSNHFSPKGLRLITQLLAQIIAKKWYRLIIPPAVASTTTTTQVKEKKLHNFQDSSQKFKWSKSISSRQRYNPMNRRIQ